MFKILEKKELADRVFEMRLDAPDIARAAQPGQFVIIKLDEEGERVPLTIADSDDKSITIVFLVVGRTTHDLSELKQGGSIQDLVGPLGKPSEMEKFGHVVVIGGGCGVAPIYPIARKLKLIGNKVTGIIGYRNKDMIFWEEKMKSALDDLHVATDDGSYGMKGFVTDALKVLLEKEKIDRVIAIGPPVMMRAVCSMTKEKGIKTIVSINSIMVDGLGMCGACRVEVGGETRFACYDGPDFDGHEVNWELLLERNATYLEEEKTAYCKCGSGREPCSR